MKDRGPYTGGSRMGWSSFGWLVPLAFFALPNCIYEPHPVEKLQGIYTKPFNSLIFCDIEDKDVPRHCADSGEAATGMRLSGGAVALVRKTDNKVALDFSSEAIAEAGCAPGQPVAITFKGSFPTGWSRCINCSAITNNYHDDSDALDANAACVDLCKEIYTKPSSYASDETVAFCAAHARASTNANACFDNSCAGPYQPDADPRRRPEPVTWQDVSAGATADGNTLTRTDPDTTTCLPPPAPCTFFDRGADGVETITHGDGYVEFIAAETGKARILGLSPGAPPENDPTDLDIAFGFRLTEGNQILISENGMPQHDPDNPDPLDNSWGEYVVGERFRIMVEQRPDGAADVSYWVLLPGCDGITCLGTKKRTAGPSTYPFRVDASLRSQGATLTDVRLVRIK